MLNLIIYSTKAALIGLWVFTLLGLLSISPIPAEYQFNVLALAGVVLLVHFIEYLLMKTKVKNKAQIDMSFVQTML